MRHLETTLTDEFIPTMLTIQECADRTGIAYGTIRRWILSGDITTVRAGSKYYVNWNKFLAFLNGDEASTTDF